MGRGEVSGGGGARERRRANVDGALLPLWEDIWSTISSNRLRRIGGDFQTTRVDMCILRRRREAGRGSALARTDGLSRGVPREDLVREALELVAHLIAAELALEVHGDVPLERDRDSRAVDVRDAVRARAEKHLLDAVLEPARAGEDGGRDARGEGRGSQIADSSGGAGKGGGFDAPGTAPRARGRGFRDCDKHARRRNDGFCGDRGSSITRRRPVSAVATARRGRSLDAHLVGNRFRNSASWAYTRPSSSARCRGWGEGMSSVREGG